MQLIKPTKVVHRDRDIVSRAAEASFHNQISDRHPELIKLELHCRFDQIIELSVLAVSQLHTNLFHELSKRGCAAVNRYDGV